MAAPSRGGRARGAGRAPSAQRPPCHGGALAALRRHPLRAVGALATLAMLWFLFALFQPFHGDGKGRVVVHPERGERQRGRRHPRRQGVVSAGPCSRCASRGRQADESIRAASSSPQACPTARRSTRLDRAGEGGRDGHDPRGLQPRAGRAAGRSGPQGELHEGDDRLEVPQPRQVRRQDRRTSRASCSRPPTNWTERAGRGPGPAAAAGFARRSSGST